MIGDKTKIDIWEICATSGTLPMFSASKKKT